MLGEDDITSYHTITHVVISHHFTPLHFTSHRTSHRIASHRIASHRITSHCITSHRIVCIISYNKTSDNVIIVPVSYDIISCHIMCIVSCGGDTGIQTTQVLPSANDGPGRPSGGARAGHPRQRHGRLKLAEGGKGGGDGSSGESVRAGFSKIYDLSPAWAKWLNNPPSLLITSSFR